MPLHTIIQKQTEIVGGPEPPTVIVMPLLLIQSHIETLALWSTRLYYRSVKCSKTRGTGGPRSLNPPICHNGSHSMEPGVPANWSGFLPRYFHTVCGGIPDKPHNIRILLIRVIIVTNITVAVVIVAGLQVAERALQLCISHS
jgi:hypothetical protein